MKTQTNIQKVNHLMIVNPGGPLAQAFIIEAVRRYAAELVQAGPPEDNPRALINPVAWYDTARALADQIDHWPDR